MDDVQQRVLGFGNVSEGQLGLGGIEEDSVNRLVELKLTDEFSGCREIACGRSHTLFLLSTNAVFACGNNDYGQLGYDGPRKRPKLVELLAGLSIAQICCGDNHSTALTVDGHLYTWGCNSDGQLGCTVANSNNANSRIHIFEVNLTKIVQVTCGSNHCMALEANGVVYSWGANNFGQLGLDNTVAQSSPQPLSKLHGIPVMQIAAGSCHSTVISSSGSVYAWGKNSSGQLGLGDSTDRRIPVLNRSLRDQKIVRLVCGADFTTAISFDGQLFTFGAGTYGQLGHGTKNNEILPKQVVEMMGTKVVDVACGRCHMLVLTNDKLYSFGLNTSGQLGLASFAQCYSLPQLVTASCKPNWRVFAGGDFSFLLTSAEPIVVVGGGGGGVPRPKSIVTLSMNDWQQQPTDSTMSSSDSDSHSQLLYALSSLNCLDGSFLKAPPDCFGTSAVNSGISMDDAMQWFSALAERCSSLSLLEQRVTRSIELSVIPSLSSSPAGLEALRAYVVLPWCHLFLMYNNYGNIVVPFSCCFAALSDVAWEVVESWWLCMAERHLNRILKVFKQVVVHFINVQATSGINPSTVEVTFRKTAIKNSLDILSHLHKVNKKCRKIPMSNFYVDELQHKVDVRSDYIAWLFRKSDTQFSFCYYPFVFNAVVKATLLQVDMGVQMQLHAEASAMSSFHSLFSMAPTHTASPFLLLTVSRNNIVGDTLSQLIGLNAGDLKRPMKVQFVGEEADDAGGVKKEFFMLLFQELLHPKYSMFVEFPESRQIWFSTITFEDPRTYEFIGIVCGLAIYNGVIVALPFPLALYKKILGEPVCLEDLKELSPTEGKSLECLLDYDGQDLAETFNLTFSISLAAFGANEEVELKPGGGSTAVTKSNRQEFVDLYVDYKLNQSVDARFKPFLAGFKRVVTSQLIQFFQPEELMELVIGNEQYDWYEFERCTEYRGEYWRDHPTIKLFWEVFHSLTTIQKKKFLLFLTGSDRIPFLGMSQIKMIVEPTGGGPQYYPVAHTCFNLLDLPKFTDKETLAKKLVEAIEHNQGFTLI